MQEDTTMPAGNDQAAAPVEPATEAPTEEVVAPEVAPAAPVEAPVEETPVAPTV